MTAMSYPSPNLASKKASTWTKLAAMLKRERGLVLGLLLVAFTQQNSSAAEKPPTLRWVEGQSGCTFSAGDDGKYRYGLWTNDFGVVVAVDADELRNAIRRTEPVFTLLLTAHYRGKDSITINPAAITLEFVKHDHEVQHGVDSFALARRFQADADDYAAQVQREISKHPEKKAEKESELQARQANVNDMLEFLRTRSLRAVTIAPAHPEASGWVFFNARSRWIGDWKRQEQFVLRIPLKNQILEFPFALPPSEGDLLLRRR
jgi:hypothetical protein